MSKQTKNDDFIYYKLMTGATKGIVLTLFLIVFSCALILTFGLFQHIAVLALQEFTT